jgi:hypothetical protein
MVKKSKEKDEGYEFTMPDFDEKEFIFGEKRKARTYFLSFAFGIIMGIVCHFAWRGISPSYRWALTFLLAIASIGFLAKLLQLFKVDISQFGKKEWFGSIAFYFFTWLAIFIISINPPFYDASGPEIDSVSIPSVQEAGSSLVIAAKVTDNVGVENVVINISDGTSWEEHSMSKQDLIYSYQFHTNNTGLYNYTISAEDDHGHTSTSEGNFTVGNSLIIVDIPDQPLEATDEIKIMVRADISKKPDISDSDNPYLVYYIIEGTAVNATRLVIDGKNVPDVIDGILYYVYTTTPEYIGWEGASTVQFTLFVKTTYYFIGVEEPIEHTIDGGTYSVSTTTDSSIGSTTSPIIKDLPKPRPLRQVVGFELVIFLAALGVLLIVRHRR